MRLSVVICTYERYELLSEALAALAVQTMAPGDFEILVMDNSRDAERAAAESRKYADMANLTWHHLDRPGLSNARNFGTAAAKSDIVAFLDDDAIAVPGWAEAIVAAFDALGPKVAAVGGKVSPLFRVPRPDWLSDKMLSQLSMVDLGDKRRPIAAGEWVVGANVAYRGDLLVDMGGFSNNLGRVGNMGLLSAEETEVNHKLYAEGYEIAYDPDARVEHIVDGSRTNQAWFARRIAWQAVSALLAGEMGSAEDIAHAADAIRRYFAALHPADRHIGALLAEIEKPEDLDWQYGTIYNVILLLLAGGHAEPAGNPVDAAPTEMPAEAPTEALAAGQDDAPSQPASEPVSELASDATSGETPAEPSESAAPRSDAETAAAPSDTPATAPAAVKAGKKPATSAPRTPAADKPATKRAPASPPPEKSSDDA